MEKDFNKTPSFFNNNETFEKYLGHTSYYLGLQNNVLKIIKMIAPKKILELGSATGATSIFIAENNLQSKIVGIDMRKEVVDIANNSIKEKKLNNLSFEVGDMLKIAKNKLDFDFILMLYSFHHILDPLSNKIQFLKDLYENIPKGSYVCIAETFISNNAISIHDEKNILDLWSIRKNEGYASTFWASLKSLSKNDIQMAKEVGEYCAKNEYFAGELVAQRKDEYLIQSKWLVEKAKEARFVVVLDEPINMIEDKIILLRKE